MKKVSQKTIQSLVKLFRSLISRERVLDADLGKASAKVIKTYEDHDDEMRFFVGEVGLGLGQAKRYRNLGTLWLAVPDAALWITYGTSGVELLSRVESDEVREKVTREAQRLAVADGSKGSVQHKHLTDALKKFAPEVFDKPAAEQKRAHSTRQHPGQILDAVTVELREACVKNPRLLSLLKKEAPGVVNTLGLVKQLEAVA